MKPGVLVISHGSRESGWVALVDDAIATAKAALAVADLTVEAGFLELVEGRLIQDGIDRLEASGVQEIFALPLFVSAGSTHVDEIGWALGAYEAPKTETDLQPYRRRASLRYGTPLGDDPETVDVLLERVIGLSRDPSRESVLLIGHGSEHPGFHEAWHAELTRLAAAVRAEGGFADAAIAMLRPDMAAKAVRELRERDPDRAVLAVPVFLSEGYFTKHVIPERLDGLACRYDGRALMPHPAVPRWIARRIAEWLVTRR